MDNDKFWSKVDKSGDCWIWTGATAGPMKYGHVYIPTIHKHPIRAHRYVWLTNVGEIPAGMYVLHKCDTPRCVNPNHLFLGTKKDNAMDCARKGRLNTATWRVGEKNPSAKLTAPIVLNIRRSNGSQKEIAKKFGVSQATVSLIKTRKIWAHVTSSTDR